MMAKRSAKPEAAKDAVPAFIAAGAELTRDEIAAREVFKRQLIFWLAALAIFGVFLWLFSSILLPFVVGMTLAYFLDPVADRLEKAGLSRLMATLFILLTFIVLFIAFVMIVVPVPRKA